jgi:hypothetical protein
MALVVKGRMFIKLRHAIPHVREIILETLRQDKKEITGGEIVYLHGDYL